MAALDFPASPTTGQLFTGANGVSYLWNGTIWVVQTGPGGGTGDFYALGSTGTTNTSTPTVVIPATISSGNSGATPPYNTSNGRYTPPAGRYNLFGFMLATVGAAANSVYLYLYKNGIAIGASTGAYGAATSAAVSLSIEAIVDANGTDYFELRSQSVGSAATIAAMGFGGSPLTGVQGPAGPPGGGPANSDFFARGIVPSSLPTTAAPIKPNVIMTGGTYYSSTTGRFIPPAGRYLLWGWVDSYITTSGSMTINAFLAKNGALLANSDAGSVVAAVPSSVFVQTIADANGTDYFELWAGANNSNNSVNAACFGATPTQGLPGGAGGPFLPLAGGSVTGTLNALSQLNIVGAAGGYRIVRHQTDLSGTPTTRWQTGANDDPETGSSAGSNYVINGLLDSGGGTITAVKIFRSSGSVQLYGSLNATSGFFTDTVAGGYVLFAHNQTNETGYTVPFGVRQGNNPGGTNYTEWHVGQSSTNNMFVEVADQANTKGTLTFQPYGGAVSVGGSPTEKFTVVSADNTTASIVGVYANNLSQGVGIHWDGIRKIGTATDLSINLDAKGTGFVGIGFNCTGYTTLGRDPPAASNSSHVATTAWVRTAGQSLLQTVFVETGAVATGSTIIPIDNTIPQITEGDQYMTLAITPKSATSRLIIEVTMHLASSVASINVAAALFQDSTTNALAISNQLVSSTANAMIVYSFRHVMVSGTTSATTFRVRAGPQSAATLTFNGSLGNPFFGGTLASSIVISEVA